ncbi:hypothetical protein ACEPAI_5056 [Sanghuangporus weigelae]
MGSIRALYASVGRRNAFFDVTDGGLDALVPSSSIHSPLHKRQRGRGGSSHRGDSHRGEGMDSRPQNDDNGAGSSDNNNGGLNGHCGVLFAEPCPESGGTPTTLSPASGNNTESLGSPTSEISGPTGTSSPVDTSQSGSSLPETSAANERSTEITTRTTGSVLSATDISIVSGPTTSTLDSISSDILASETSNSDTLPTDSPQVAAATGSNKTGAIVGGVLGGLVFVLLLILGAILFLRRRRRKRTPASAEFRDRYIPRSTAPPPPLRHPLAAQTSRESLDPDGDGDGADDFAEMRYHPSEPPPPFTKGSFSDPLFEKIYETQQKNLKYGLAS